MRRFLKNGSRRLCMVTVAMLLAGSMTACGSNADEKQDVMDTLESAAQEVRTGETVPTEDMQMQNGYFGEITAIDGTTLTVTVMTGGRGDSWILNGEQAEGMEPVEMFGGEQAEGMEPIEMFGGEQPEGMESNEMFGGEQPEGMEPVEMFGGERPEGMEPGEISDGELPKGRNAKDIPTETMTVEVSDSTIITVDGEEAVLSDLQVGDSIRVNVDEGVAVTIYVGRHAGMAGAMGAVPDEKQPAETKE